MTFGSSLQTYKAYLPSFFLSHLKQWTVVFPQLSAKSFPPCMRQVHQALRENHHLRHGGRMQYGLFLKGIGLSLEQSLQFWRSEFIRGKVDADKVMMKAFVFKCNYYHKHLQCNILFVLKINKWIRNIKISSSRRRRWALQKNQVQYGSIRV